MRIFGENRMLGGVNDSDLHWDLLVMEPRVEVDDQLIMEGGAFLAQAFIEEEIL